MNTEIADSVLQEALRCDLPAGSTVVVAFSGGPDSLCLLEVLSGLVNAGKLNIKLTACHVDHMLRPCSGSDAEFARQYAESLGIPFELRQEDVGEAAAELGTCIENAARQVRYRLLEEAALAKGARAVATGHNLDDQAETVIMRILRGTGITGLSGIKATRPISAGSEILLVRPLLGVTRKQIISYLNEKKLEYMTDETNLDTSYLRNRIRAQLLPLLEERFSPGIRHSLARLAQSAASASELLQTETDQAFEMSLLEKSEDSVKLKLAQLQITSGFLLYEILSKAFDILGFHGILTRAKFEAIAAAVHEGRTSGRLTPGAGASVEFQGNSVLVTRLPFPGKIREWEVMLQVPGWTKLEQLGAQLDCEIVDRDDFDLAVFKKSKSTQEEALDADKAGRLLSVRTIRPGDSFRPLGLGGTKKISDFLVDRKVPLRQKAGEAVVAVDGKIAWLIGRRLDERFAVGEKTRRVMLLSVMREMGETV
jgi:tRNA(Ile)-lysidine synthase